MTHLDQEELEDLSRLAFQRVGVPPEDAGAAARILVGANLLGIDSHGVQRVVPYVSRIRQGVLKANPNIKVLTKSLAVAVVDGDDGLGPVVGYRGLTESIRLASESGIAYVGCLNSNHFGAIAPYLWIGCRQKMICIIGTNAFTTMAPWGGREVKVGNNPIGIGAPRRDGFPFLLDIAMSVASRGKIRAAGERGESIPEGWGANPEGNPTTDPIAALKGFVLPFGGHKGYGLALAIDILSGVLTGGAFATQVKSMFQQAGESQHVAHFFITINPAMILGLEAYYDQMESFCALIKDTKRARANAPVLLPGEIEEGTFEERSASGIPLDEDLCETLRALARGISADSNTTL